MERRLLQKHHELIGAAVTYNLDVFDLCMTGGNKVQQIVAVKSGWHGQQAELVRWSFLDGLAFAEAYKNNGE